MQQEFDAAGLPDSVEIVLPPGWADIPMSAAEQADFVSTVAQAAQSAGTPLRTSDRRQMDLVVAQMAALASTQNVLISSAYLAPPSEAEGDDGAVMAGLIVSAVDRESFGTDIPLVGEVLVAGLSSIERGSNGTEYDEIEPPRLVSLVERECVKLVRLSKYRDSKRRELKQFEQTYLVPVGQGDGLIILQFSTINFEHAKQFSELFEKIAGTLRILYPDDPTFEDDVESASAAPHGGSD